MAAASSLPWTSLRCAVIGTLDRVDRVILFTHLKFQVHLEVPAHASLDLARRVLDKAERGCLITSSLKATTQLDVELEQAAEPADHQEPAFVGEG
jgi:hypothetical protein